MKEFFNKIHYEKAPTILQRIVGLFLFLGVPFYFFGSQLKNVLYKLNILKSFKISGAKVISIGNITTGGVGKTPIVAQIANYLSKTHNVAILSRGYGGKLNSKEINVIKKDGQILFSANLAGDEPFWLAQNTNENVKILTCSNRVKIADFAVENFGCDVLILDDGFQHQKLKRDLNIAVFDASKFIGNGFVLPLGPLREPLFNINRADKIIFVNKNLSEIEVDGVIKKAEIRFKKQVYKCDVVADYIYDIHTKDVVSEKNKIGAFCAIGQPDLFYQYLKDYNLVFTKSFSDHHSYTQNDVNELVNECVKNDVSDLITTEKDAVKLMNFDFKNIKVCALKIAPSLNLEELLNEKA